MEAMLAVVKAEGVLHRTVATPGRSALLRLSDRLTKVSSREFSSRSCLEIPLEPQRRFFFVKFYTDQRSPWSISRRVTRHRRIVGTQPRSRIGRDANVVLLRIILALEDVNESLRFQHP
jgi:hypothetical protein